MTLSRRCFFKLCALFSWGAQQAVAASARNEYELDSFYIAGFQYHEGPDVIDRMRSGDRIAICAEPENPYDAGALRLEFAGRHIGYVPRTRNAIPGRLLAQQATLCGRLVSVDPDAEPWRAVKVVVSLVV